MKQKKDILIKYSSIKTFDKIIKNSIDYESIITFYTQLRETLNLFIGKEFSFLKENLSEALIEKIVPIGNEVKKMLSDSKFLEEVLNLGSEKAREEAKKNLMDIKEIVGLI